MRIAAGALAFCLLVFRSPVLFAAKQPSLNGPSFNLVDPVDSKPANLTEADFRRIAANLTALYAPLAQEHGGVLRPVLAWQDDFADAYVERDGTDWSVHLFGGLARRSELTADGFALIVCHEFGHHFGGYPFSTDTDWGADEGEADYFATHACARRLWGGDLAHNEALRFSTPIDVQAVCNGAKAEREAQNLCYRTILAGQSMAALDVAGSGVRTPTLATPDTSMVETTNHQHAAAQCRFDTFVAGALCNTAFDDHVIPGLRPSGGQHSAFAEDSAAAYSCSRGAGSGPGQRPRCWFAPERHLSIEPLAAVPPSFAPGEAVALVPRLVNTHQEAVAAATAEIGPVPSAIELDNSRIAFGPISPGDEALPLHPFTFKISADASCGELLRLPVMIRSSAGDDAASLKLRIGRFVLGDPVEGAAHQPVPETRSGLRTSLDIVDSGGQVVGATVTLNVHGPTPELLAAIVIDPSKGVHILKGAGASPWQTSYDIELAASTKVVGPWQLLLIGQVPGRGEVLDSWSITLHHGVCL